VLRCSCRRRPNAPMESFNRTFRAECLDVHSFMTLAEAQQVVESWTQEYNKSSSPVPRGEDAE